MSDLDFADDIAALADTPNDLQCLLDVIKTSADSTGLTMNAKKAKNMQAETHSSPTSMHVDQGGRRSGG